MKTLTSEPWVPAVDAVSAQNTLDGFQQEFATLTSTRAEMIVRGRSIIKEVNKLDVMLFGSADPALPAVVRVGEAVRKLEASGGRMEAAAGPRLAQHQDCLQFYLLQQRASKVSESSSRSLPLCPLPLPLFFLPSSSPSL